jgi:phenylacetate-CoA ligase
MLALSAASPLAHLHAAFLSILPRIERHGQIYFRHARCPQTKDDAIAEMVALTWRWFLRLIAKGKDPLSFPMMLASYAARQVNEGRRLVRKEKSKDVLSLCAQKQHSFTVESLPSSTASSFEERYTMVHGQQKQDVFEERLRENTQTPDLLDHHEEVDNAGRAGPSGQDNVPLVSVQKTRRASVATEICQTPVVKCTAPAHNEALIPSPSAAMQGKRFGHHRGETLMPLRSELRPPQPPALLQQFFGAALDQAIEDWTETKLRAYQEAAVAEQLRRAADAPFYREKFTKAGRSPADFQTLEDLEKFPFTDKSELLRQPWKLLAVPREEVRLAHTSTGTTGGDWSYQLYTWEDMFLRDVVPMPWKLLDVQAGEVVVNALPYEMSSAGQSFQRSLQAGAGALVVPAGKGGFYSDPGKTIGVMADVQASLLITTPPHAMQLSELAAQQGRAIPLRRLWLTGEGCAPSYRRRLEQRWQCPTRVFYGSLECGPIGLDSSPQSGLHVCAGHVCLEIIDPKTGKSLPRGQLGEVICTVLQRTASPLIRFRLRDLACLDPGPCPLGYALPRLHLRGRLADQVPETGAAPAAGAVSPYAIEDVLYRYPEMGGNYQVYVGPVGRLAIDVELDCSEEKRSAVLAQMRDGLRPILEPAGWQAELSWVPWIPRSGGKARRIRARSEREQVMAAAHQSSSAD